MKSPLFILAVDHRPVMVKPCEERGVDLQRLRDFKALAVEAVAAAQQARPRLADQMRVILDDVYGGLALETARRLGVKAARPVERGGATPLEFERPDWERTIVGSAPSFIKVKFQGGPRQEGPVRMEQERKLLEVSRACEARGVPLVPEPLLHPKPKGMSELEAALAMTEWIGSLRRLGLKARFWKIEGFSDPAAAAELAKSVPANEGLLLLGGSMTRLELGRCFAATRGQRAFEGFAVGRSIFWEPYLEYLDRADPATARAGVQARYLEVVDEWSR